MDISTIAFEPVDQCPLCRAVERALFERGETEPKGIHLMRCVKCGFIYTSAAVRSDHIASLYNSFNADRDVERPEMRTRRLAMYEIDRAFTRRFLAKSALRLLDVGSGTGDFIAGFDDAMELYAVEIDGIARENCKDIYPNLQLYSELAAIPSDVQFDAMFFRGTLQYMPDLHWVADYCMRHVRPNGYLFVLATPNAESILAQVQREQWVLADNIEHRYWFTPPHLVSLFGEAFRMRGYDFPYLGTPYENYPTDLIKVLAMFDDPEARNIRVPFFGSMMNVALERV